METVLLTFIAQFALDYAPNPKLSKFKNRISYLRLFVMGPSVIIFIISSQIIDKWQWFQINRKNDIYVVELALIWMKLMPRNPMVMEARAK